MTGIRYVARCYHERQWGIVDRQAKKWVMVEFNRRWTGSQAAAEYNANAWNEAGHRIYSGV